MNRVARTRVPLGQRSVNVDNNAGNGNGGGGKGGGGKGNGNGKPSLGLSKQGSSRSNVTLERQKTSSSCASTTASGSDFSSTTAENRAFSSMSSDVLRKAIGSASSMASLGGGGGGNASAGSNRENGVATAVPGGKKKGDAAQAKKQPLGTSKQQNQQAPDPKRSNKLLVAKPEKPSSSEPVTIVEHRKRPCGDGYTVHKYLRGKLLGKGGFAKVYKVTSLDTNKEYAVKIVPKANLVKSRARQKLQTEIKIHRTMKHANICEYKHFFEDKTNCYILLELCHNQSVNEMIKRRKSLTEEEARLLMLQIVDAVGFMHDCNVIHRDLKLGNLFLSRGMTVKVGDFGLACRVDSTDEKRKTICGTPNYIAPEVIEGNKERRGHSFEVDVWSMGVICFTMLVGKPPYESKDVKSTYRRILANDYSFPAGRVGEDARALIGSMLQTDPKARPSLNDIRQHPFFTHYQIPGSLPSTCTVSAPIWSTDEFGELYAVKPTSALDVRVKSSGSSSSRPAGLKRADSVLKIAAASKASKKTAKVAKAGAFNIYDDVNDQVECKLDSQSNAFKSDNAEAMHAEAKKEESTTPVNQLAEKMSSCAFNDDGREMPPGSSSPASPGPDAPTPPAEQSDPKHGTPSHPDSTASAKPASSSGSSSPSGTNDDMNELAMMHTRLEECLANYERIQNGGAKVECPLRGGEVWGANKWVTRYVDYTSKYGLGFLLNDGSSGVYFNDSTKAVHAATGDEFVYVERRKAGVGGVREPVSVYTLTSYPEEALKKKVTLLQHFRSYLLEQQKRAEEAGEAEPLSTNDYDERGDTSSGRADVGAAVAPMVFMKKWIKTKHAMLFRLSNGTVQVLFYDATEVLISSEGNLVTYVDKEKNRFVHSIAEVANKQHSDVCRRLKYAKEILSQLISASAKRG